MGTRALLVVWFVAATLVPSATGQDQTQSLGASSRRFGKGTQVRLFTSFQPGGLSDGISAGPSGSGKCFAESAADPARPDAWRCSIGNAINDPCFVSTMGNPETLACVRSPWDRKVTMLKLEEPLPQRDHPPPGMTTALPWALELAGGQHCTLLTGGTGVIAGMRINYGCVGGMNVVGDPDRTYVYWRVFAQQPKAHTLDQVEVLVAWY